LLYGIVFHFFAGVLTGSVFKVGTLLALLVFVFSEAVVFVTVNPVFSAAWGIANLLGIQLGYCAGLYLRGLAEQAGYSLPPVGVRSSE
jgi:hypothetical protein